MYRINLEVNWQLGLLYNRFLNFNFKDYGLLFLNNVDRLEINLFLIFIFNQVFVIIFVGGFDIFWLS